MTHRSRFEKPVYKLAYASNSRPFRLKQDTPSLRRMARREQIGPDIINAIQARFFASQSLPRLVEGVGVADHIVFTADSEHGGTLEQQWRGSTGNDSA